MPRVVLFPVLCPDRVFIAEMIADNISSRKGILDWFSSDIKFKGSEDESMTKEWMAVV